MSPAQPSWFYGACRLLDKASAQHVRITALHLTAQQAQELKAFTGDDDRCLGYPVHVVQRPNPMPTTPPPGFAIPERETRRDWRRPTEPPPPLTTWP